MTARTVWFLIFFPIAAPVFACPDGCVCDASGRVTQVANTQAFNAWVSVNPSAAASLSFGAGSLSPTSSASQRQGQVAQGGQGGNASAQNGDQAVFVDAADRSSTSIGGDETFIFTPVQVAPLPPEIAVGTLKLAKVSECGPMVIIDPFRQALIKRGFFSDDEIPVATEHGIATPAAMPYVDEEYVALNGDVYKIRRGHAIYLTVGTVGGGAGASLSASLAGGSDAGGAGLSKSANFSLGQVGRVAVSCEKEKYKVEKKPEEPKRVSFELDTLTTRNVVTEPPREPVVVLKSDALAKLRKEHPELFVAVPGKPGKRVETFEATDCLKGSDPQKAACAAAKAKIGKGELRSEEIIPAPATPTAKKK